MSLYELITWEVNPRWGNPGTALSCTGLMAEPMHSGISRMVLGVVSRFKMGTGDLSWLAKGSLVSIPCFLSYGKS